MDEKAFIEMMLELMRLKRTEQAKTFASRMFHFFDDDGGGAVDWQEFGAGLSMVCRGSKIERLRCVYMLIDGRGNPNPT